MFRPFQTAMLTVLAAYLLQPPIGLAQAPDSAALAAAVVTEEAKWRKIVLPKPPAAPTPWELVLYRAFRRADRRPTPSDTSSYWWIRLAHSDLRFSHDTAVVDVTIVVCWKGQGGPHLKGYGTRYLYSSGESQWRLLNAQPGVMGTGSCLPEGPGSHLRITAEDSVGLARAVARELAEGQLPVRTLPPTSPDAWESLLQQQLDYLQLPEPEAPVHWLQLERSRVYEDEGRVLVEVKDRVCVGPDPEPRVGGHMHVVEYQFKHVDGAWQSIDWGMKLSGTGSCSSSGPRPVPRH